MLNWQLAHIFIFFEFLQLFPNLFMECLSQITPGCFTGTGQSGYQSQLNTIRGEEMN